MPTILRAGIVGTGVALSALLAWNIALAQSQSVTPTPAAKPPQTAPAPAQVAQATTGMTTTITGTAGTAAVEGAFGFLGEATVFTLSTAVVAAGALVQESQTESATATATGTK